MSEESDNFEFSDEEIDSNNHESIVENVLKLNKVQNVKSARRTEPSTQISEFNLVKSLGSSTNLVHVNDLTNVLKKRKNFSEVNSKVKSLSGRSQTLSTPLEKPQAEKIQRTLNYEKSRLQLDRWEALVASNRSAPQLTFPLDHIEKVKIIEKKAEVYPSTFTFKSDLQKKLEELEPKVEEYNVGTEDQEELSLTLEELKQKRKESARLRARQSFKEAKARQQNKIKSKKYHRILRREKIKLKLKELEELQKNNPEEALKKLDDIEKARAEERFSLRHKGTGKWAKNKQIRAKYDKESRQALAQQLAISRELTQKLKSLSDSEDEEIESEKLPLPSTQTNNANPWVNGIKPAQEVADFFSGYRKFWNEKNQKNIKESGALEDKNISKNISEENKVVKKTKKSLKRKKKNTEVLEPKKTCKSNSVGTLEWEVSKIDNPRTSLDVEDIFDTVENKLSKKFNKKLKQIKKKLKTKDKDDNSKKEAQKRPTFDLSIPSRRKKQIIDEELLEGKSNTNESNTNDNIAAMKSILSAKQTENTQQNVNVNSNQFLNVKTTNLITAVPDISVTDENEESEYKDIMAEALEDDDIAADFEKEKQAEIEKDTPKDIDLNLPGWGSWAGSGIDSSKRRKKRFIIKMPKQMPRKDANKGSLIINEKAQTKIKPHLVSEVPFPFKSVKDYEASIRAPVGNTFVPETAFRKFIEPAVVTKMGAIIEPINHGILVGTKKII